MRPDGRSRQRADTTSGTRPAGALAQSGRKRRATLSAQVTKSAPNATDAYDIGMPSLGDTIKLNLFRIPVGYRRWMESKLLTSGLEVIHRSHQGDWTGEFYFSKAPEPAPIAWLDPYDSFFAEGERPENQLHFAAFVFWTKTSCYALSHGKAHFYLRPFCDFDFGIELAKRIANEGDIAQTASKRFQGRRKKNIRSYTANSRLEVESGESFDYLQAGIIDVARDRFGRRAKFGTSALLNVDILVDDIGELLTAVDAQLTADPLFKLPRTTVVTDEVLIQRYDRALLAEVASGSRDADFAHNTYDLYGVDFVFPTDGTFELRCPGYPSRTLSDLGIEDLRAYVSDFKIPQNDVMCIRIGHSHDNRTYTQSLKQSLDYIADEDRVVLSGGKWMRFNQDYLEFLDEYIDTIPLLPVETEFEVISMPEPKFNASLADYGYAVADKDFSIFTTRSATPVEAWDHRKGDTVYAVKFGTAQKLGYVCDQASNLLELLRNRAGVRQIPDFKKYCLWLGYAAKKDLGQMRNTRSIILKQKIDAWARKCRDLSIEPVIKLSRKVPDPNSEAP